MKKQKVKREIFVDIPNNYTAILAGICTSIVGLSLERIEQIFLESPFVWLPMIPVFLASVIYWVVGKENIGMSNRFKDYGIKAFIFPCCQKEAKIGLRMFLWFLGAACVMFLSDCIK